MLYALTHENLDTAAKIAFTQTYENCTYARLDMLFESTGAVFQLENRWSHNRKLSHPTSPPRLARKGIVGRLE